MEQSPTIINIASGMRILLQNTETKLYFAGPNEWTGDLAKAWDFEEIELASEVYNTQNMDYAEIILEPEGRPGSREEVPRLSGRPERPSGVPPD